MIIVLSYGINMWAEVSSFKIYAFYRRRDGQTDRHFLMAYAAMHSIERGKKSIKIRQIIKQLAQL